MLYGLMAFFTVVTMQDASGNVFIGKVWPGFTAYPDFLNPKTIQYWQNEVSSFSVPVLVKETLEISELLRGWGGGAGQAISS